jgi:hypothetical protein
MAQTNSEPKVGKHHSLNCQGLSPLFQGPPYRLVADALDHLELDELVRQELHGPVAAAFGWVATGEGNEVSLLPASEEWDFTGVSPVVKGSVYSHFNAAPAIVADRVRMEPQLSGDLVVSLALVCRQECQGPLHLANLALAFVREGQEPFALFRRELNDVPFQCLLLATPLARPVCTLTSDHFNVAMY